MSRNLLILLVVLILACYGATILYLGPAPPSEPLKPEVNITEPVGLSVVSLGEEIPVPNETVLIERIEQLAEENYPNWVAGGYVDPIPYRQEGIVITATYPSSLELRWIVPEYGDIPDTPVEKIHPIRVKEITVVIPENTGSERRPWILVYPDQERNFQFTLQLSSGQADELRELIGQTPARITPA